jgi:hypothetical protein
VDGKPAFVINPEGAADRDTANWLAHQLDPQARP